MICYVTYFSVEECTYELKQLKVVINFIDIFCLNISNIIFLTEYYFCDLREKGYQIELSIIDETFSFYVKFAKRNGCIKNDLN